MWSDRGKYGNVIKEENTKQIKEMKADRWQEIKRQTVTRRWAQGKSVGARLMYDGKWKQEERKKDCKEEI